MVELVGRIGQRDLCIWVMACVERVMPYFEADFGWDRRPREALDVLQAWIDSGCFQMAVIRGAALGAHAAAREVGEDNPARSVARSAGQAVATAHVAAHALAAANYALQAIHRVADASACEAMVDAERDWQYRELLGMSGDA